MKPPFVPAAPVFLALLCLSRPAEAQTPSAGFQKAFYPRTKEEIRAGLKEIASRKPPASLPGDVDTKRRQGDFKLLQEGLNELNAFRFLSGVPHGVTLDGALVSAADEAARACEKAGHLGHDLGGNTDKCNLHGATGTAGRYADSIRGYIRDDGENNREKRGHRWWCLTPQLGKTGLGRAGGFQAMYVFDKSGPKPAGSWAIPGKGWYPAEYVPGDSWSLYLPKNAPPADQLKVRMWKLNGQPQQALKNPEAPIGKPVTIKAVFTFANAINFEPEIAPKKDTYFIKVEGPGVSEAYLVDLF